MLCDLKLSLALGGLEWLGVSKVFPAEPGGVDPLQGDAVTLSHLPS